ncbi:MAG TPA: four helix bundle protein [Acidobacteriota bacterium]|jgi:four helix bundle protein|nr:four helix bundle protein [Acidobacteriota bacterium]
MAERYAFRKTILYDLGIEYVDALYRLTERLSTKTPESLRTQIIEAATHILVNIAGKSSGKTDIEHSFLVDGCRMSLFETIACLDIAERLRYARRSDLKKVRSKADRLLDKLDSMKKALNH